MKKKIIISLIAVLFIGGLVYITIPQKQNIAPNSSNSDPIIDSQNSDINNDNDNQNNVKDKDNNSNNNDNNNNESSNTQNNNPNNIVNEENSNNNNNSTSSGNNNNNNNNNNTNNNSNNNNNNNNSSNTTQDNKPVEDPTPTPVVDENDVLRKQIENAYGITIKYGNEMSGYRPKGLTPTILTDETKINKYLNIINTEFKKYPNGFFRDFSGMPLTIYLVSSVPGNAFSGFTDHELMYDIKLTLTENTLFDYTLNHEIMHYIDAYLEIKMWPNNPYDEYIALNPPGFTYGSVNSTYNYGYNGNTKGAYFIDDYAQYNAREDRAELFKQMVTRVYKPLGMFDSGEVLQKKALIIDNQIRTYFSSAKGTLFWDKYIK